MILKQREGLRREKLKWFTAFREDKAKVINSKIILLGGSQKKEWQSR